MLKCKSTNAEPNLAPCKRQPADEPAAATKFDLEIATRLSRELGVSPVTFWRWRHLPGFPPGTRINRRIYFSRSAIREWLDKQQDAA
jgi:predicted DNA-binding transcriptional regulator AlpA